MKRGKIWLGCDHDFDDLRLINAFLQADEAEKRRLIQQAEKEKSAKNKEEKKKREEQERLEKEALKKAETASKEKLREEDRAYKEKLKNLEKAKATHRKEVAAEIKKNRTDSLAAVLVAFDREEDAEDSFSLAQAALQTVNFAETPRADPVNSKFSEWLESVPSCSNAFHTEHCENHCSARDLYLRQISGDRKDSHWDDAFRIANALFVFREYLSLEPQVRVDDLLQALCSVSDLCRPHNHGSDAMSELLPMDIDHSALGPVDGNSLEGSADARPVDKGVAVTAAVNPSAQPVGTVEVSTESQVLLDRLHLRLLQKVCKELFPILESDPAGGGSNPKLPLNQLTWPELARQSIILHICADVGKTKDEVFHILRGSRNAQQYCSSKNVLRRIRSRLWWRLQVQENARLKTLLKEVATDVSKRGAHSGLLFQTQQQNSAGFCSAYDKLIIIADSFDRHIYGHKTEQDGEMEVSYMTPRQAPAMQNIFSTESELTQNMIDILGDDSFPEVYRRCVKVTRVDA
jgi:hypothetical protein